MGNTHLVPVVLLVGKHQEAPVVDEDADEVLGKDSSVTHPLAMPRARQDWQGGGADGQSGRRGPARRPQVWGPLRSTSVPGAPVLGTGSRNNRPPWGV